MLASRHRVSFLMNKVHKRIIHHAGVLLISLSLSHAADMKYSPQQQQQQQKQRKSESSDAASVDATLSRTSASVAQEQRKSSSTSSSTRPAVCRSPSTGMFAWMRVFRLASMLHQVGC